MPRQARLDVPGTLHHVMVRGIEQQNIFEHEEDRQAFVDQLRSLVLDTGTRILAWALMDNHVHLLLISGPVGLRTFMRRLLTGYAISYNPAGSGITSFKTAINRPSASWIPFSWNWSAIPCGPRRSRTWRSWRSIPGVAEIARQVGGGTTGVAMAVRKMTA